MITYITPGGTIHAAYSAVLESNHTFIAGCTGSGKSTFLHGLLYTILAVHSPISARLVLIDLKRVELRRYAKTPHCIAYADTVDTAINTLKQLHDLMQRRFDDMDKRELSETDRPNIYLIFDEIGYFFTQTGKQAVKLLESISMLGRAAHIHLIYACQNPRKTGPGAIPAGLLLNTDCRVALRCVDKLESRLIIQSPGAENLPPVGQCLIRRGPELLRYVAPKIDAGEMQRVLYHWSAPERYIIPPDHAPRLIPWLKRLFGRA